MKICENNKIEKVLDFKMRQKFDFYFGLEPNLNLLLPTFFCITDTQCMQFGYFKVKEVASLRPIFTHTRIQSRADMTGKQQHF